MAASIAVIIPNYNGVHLLQKNLPSVIHYANQCKLSTEVIVVDDASSDGSVALLESQFMDVRLIIHSVNQGFSEAINSGVKAANSELLLLLNSDVELTEDILSPLTRYFSSPDTFSVSPLIKNEHGDINRHAWNRRQMRAGRLKARPWNIEQALNQRSKGALTTTFTSGGSMMVRKSMLLELGGFHPIFKPFYSEDFDLGLRAWARGWPSYFEPTVQVIHQDKGSIFEANTMRYIKSIQRRNRYFMEWIHFSWPQLVFSTLPISLLQLLGELITLDIVNFKAFFLAIGQLRFAHSARAELDSSRSLSLKQIIEAVRRCPDSATNCTDPLWCPDTALQNKKQ